MLTAMRWAGVGPEVNLWKPLHAGDTERKRRIHPDLETQGRRHQKSQTGLLVAYRKKILSSKN